MQRETIYFRRENILITDSRFIVGSHTFAMRNITSVRGIEIVPGVIDRLFRGKTSSSYAVVLKSANSEVKALVSDDRHLVGDALEALNKAIAHH